MGLGGVIIILHLDADALASVAARAQALGQVLHRMVTRRLDVAVGIPGHVTIVHPDRAQGAVGVLDAAPPQRIGVVEHDHTLVDVERPALVAGEPGHVGRILDEKHVDLGLGHRRAHLGQAALIFGFWKRQVDGRQCFLPRRRMRCVARQGR
jgi:hypothetical protein